MSQQGLRPGSLRTDLQTSDQTQRGRRYTVIKSPLSLTYFRLPVEHYIAAREFDGKRTLNDIASSLKENHPYWRALSLEDAISELYQLALQLASGGLLHLAGSGATARSRRMRAHANARKFEQIVGKILYFRKALLDPDKLLTRMLPYFNWAYTHLAAGGFLLLIGLTGWMLLDHREELGAQAVNFFTLSNLFLSWVLFMGVKIVHEFGHGLTCKRYGGEVHEMGFLFIMLTPYLYCDVSDSWMVASRARRVAVTAAGIVAELFLACLAAWLWHLLQPGLGRQLAFNIMIICSISTILFNANPLMKFDGYYIVTDLLEIPNLRQKGNAVISEFFTNLLAMAPAGQAISEHEKSLLFGLYAVAAYIYGWWITFHIAAVVFDKLEPYGLGFLSRSYVGLFLFVSVALPLWRLIQSFRTNSSMITPLRSPKLKWIIAIAITLLLLLLLPWRESVTAMCVVEFASREQITPGQAGWLKQWLVHEGDQVSLGQRLAELTNPDLETSLAQAKLEQQGAEVQWRDALNSPEEQIRLGAGSWQKNVQEITERIRGLEEQFASLTIKATKPGIVTMPGMDYQSGQYFPKGRRLLEIGDNHTFQLILPLDEKQARLVKVGDPVSVCLRAYPTHRLQGHLTISPTAAVESFSTPIMASSLGGEFPSEMGKQQGDLPRPAIPCYEAVVILESIPTPPPTHDFLRAGMMGRACILTRRTTLGGWLGETLLDWINPAFRF